MVKRVQSTPKAEHTPRGSYVPIAELERGLQIDENALDEAHLQHADVFYRVSKQLAAVQSQRDAAKQAIEDAEAAADTSLRETASKHSEKLTAPEIAALIRQDSDVVEARARFMALNRSVLEYAALKEAFQQRSYMLGGLTSLYSAGYFGPRSSVNDEERRRAYREQTQTKR